MKRIVLSLTVLVLSLTITSCGGTTTTTPSNPGITVGSISGNTTEAGGTATFTVVLDTAPTDTVTIAVASSDATEGSVSISSLTFTAANWSTAQTVIVTGLDDSTADGDISYTVTLGAASSSDSNYNGIDPSDVSLTNTDNDTGDVSFTLTSQDFADGEIIPLINACISLDGDNQSPELTWTNPPQDTDSYALIVDDEDSPCEAGDGACKHWSVYNIPALITSFEAGEDVTTIMDSSITEGENYTESNGYEGPCPPNQHTYNFTIYALKVGMSEIISGMAFTRSEFQSAYSQFILGSATLQGIFSPPT